MNMKTKNRTKIILSMKLICQFIIVIILSNHHKNKLKTKLSNRVIKAMIVALTKISHNIKFSII